ncbi:MAG: carotenoid 1,2-hydratase, partial [Chloroflexota bacterium]
MWRYIGLALVGIVVVVSGFSLLDVSGGGDVGAAAVLESAEISTDNYRAVDNPNYEWNFPADHGPHEDYLTEWWYYTGNVATEDGRRFGFQFTVFRRAILPDEPEQDSEWRSRQIYNGHVTISDFETEVFFKEERFGRGAAGLAGATADPRYRVWLEDWEVIALNDDATEIRMTATVEDAAFDLTLTRVKPIVLQGEDRNGLSSKGGEASNASYYYSITRMETAGTITIEGTTYDVSGLSWMDHEFSTGALP